MPESPDPSLVGEVGGLGESAAAAVQIALGAILLLFGRRLFWLLVAAVGFAVGFLAADAYLGIDSEAARWLVGLVAGAVAALAAVFLQRVAISLAGAFVAGYSTFWYLSLDGQPLRDWHWLAVGVAALFGLFIGRIVFEFALITLSVLAGATLVLENLAVGPQLSRWLFLVLVVFGAVVQASRRRTERS